MCAMSNDKTSTNPLFSPANVLNFSSNSIFLPVREQSSAILSDKSIEEEGSFIGQNNASQEKQNLATFTMFSQKNDSFGSSDPFASVASPIKADHSLPSHSKVVTSVQHEPQLFVPPASPTDQNSSDEAMKRVSELTNTNAPPLFSASNSGVAKANPYSRASHSGPRPMFPSNNQLYQPSTTQAPFQPPPSVAPSVSNKNITPDFTENYKPVNTASSQPNTEFYQPVIPHWFFCKTTEHSNIWCPFSYDDSAMLEQCFQAGHVNNDIISTDGGRYDVTLSQRLKKSVYWDEPSSSIRRCTWFYKGDNENHFTPYEEDLSVKLEIEYENVVKKSLWHKSIDLGNKETVVVHNPQLIVHYQPDPFGGDFGGVHDKQQRSKVVKRGIAATNFPLQVPAGESGQVDHLIFFCHGVGPVCDLRSRSIVECVDDFRTIHLSLLKSHFKQAVGAGGACRLEFLPIHWHRALHGDATGVDRSIRRLTLPSISRLRHFTNETLLDILFYSSPVYCQTIAETVGNEINYLYQRFMSRNPNFVGKVSVAGHSLGSLILFDLLCHQVDPAQPTPLISLAKTQPHAQPHAHPHAQPPPPPSNDEPVPSRDKRITLEQALQQLNLSSLQEKFDAEQMDMDALMMCSEEDLKGIGLPLGPRKKLMGFLKELNSPPPEAEAEIVAVEPHSGDAQKVPPPPGDPSELPLFGMNSAMNVHVDFQQFDSGTGQPFVCYPKLDFQPHALFALGSPIGMFLTVRGVAELGEDFVLPTCPNFINIFHPFDPVAYRVEPLINPDVALKPVLVPHHKGRKRLHLELKESLGRMGQELKEGIIRAIGSMQKFAKSHWSQAAVEEEVKHATEELMRDGQERAVENEDAGSCTSDSTPDDVDLGKLNGGRRIDYVLQERPLESFNDYLFAFQSHLCYWNSEDTVLFMMKEAFGAVGVSADGDNTAPPTPSV